MSVSERLRALFGAGKGQIVNVRIQPGVIPSVEGLSARRLYETQANLYAVISFLADSIAQLPLKVYVRDGEAERRRDRDSTIAKLLYRPNADQTAYEFVAASLTEYFLMGELFWWLLLDADSESGYQLRVIPAEWVQGQKFTRTKYAPSELEVTAGNGKFIIRDDEFVPFRMYSPGNPGGYQSPIASLKQTLMEQIQADKFRTEVWSSSGRFNAYITRPKDVEPWDDEQRSKFAAAFRAAWGKGGGNAGGMPILEDGMEVKPYQFNAQQAQFAETKQLSREDVAAAFHLNPSLIWHNNTQTYASAKDNARALYAECLGPTIQMFQQRINSFLIPMVGAASGTYVEFDLTEKLKGSFEERASIYQSAAGGPYMTRNEVRAEMNLPPVDGGDELIVPLNVVAGGQASPQDTHMDEQEPMTIVESGLKEAEVETKEKTVKINVNSTDEENERTAEVLSTFFRRQGKAVLPKLGASDDWWNQERWDRELADDLEPIIDEIADIHGREVAKALGSEYNTEQTRKYLRLLSEGRAAAINENTRKQIEDALLAEEEDPETENTPAHVFEVRQGNHSKTLGKAVALAVAGWAATHEAPQQAEQQGIKRQIEKTWVTGDNPRPTHEAMDGETVGIDDKFSNGAFWPGDDNLDPDESCGCNCSTEIVITF